MCSRNDEVEPLGGERHERQVISERGRLTGNPGVGEAGGDRSGYL